MKYFVHFFIIFFGLTLFQNASAAELEIVSVMANPDGADNGYEYVHIKNTGSENIPVGDLHFFEADVHHGLTPDNFTVLLPNQDAYVVQNIEQAKDRYDFSHVIKSSFSLKNSGEQIGFSDDEKNIFVSVNYNADAVPEGSVVLLSERGSFTQAVTAGDAATESSIQSSPIFSHYKNPVVRTTLEQDPYYVSILRTPSLLRENVDFNLFASAEYVRKGKSSKQETGFFRLNMGDGTLIESTKHIDQKYRYVKNGDYVIHLEYYNSRFAFENNDEPLVSETRPVYVDISGVDIATVLKGQGIRLKNNLFEIADISEWELRRRDRRYSFPDQTYIAAGGELYLDFDKTTFPPYKDDYMVLVSASGIVMSTYVKPLPKLVSSEKNQKEDSFTKSDEDVLQLGENTLLLEEAVGIDATVFDEEPSVVNHVLTESDKGKRRIPWSLVILLFLTLAFGITGIFLGKRDTPSREEGTEIDDYDIELMN